MTAQLTPDEAETLRHVLGFPADAEISSVPLAEGPMEDQQPQSQPIGIQDDNLLKLVRGYATLEAGFLMQQQKMDELQAENETLKGKVSEMAKRLADIDRHICPGPAVLHGMQTGSPLTWATDQQDVAG